MEGVEQSAARCNRELGLRKMEEYMSPLSIQGSDTPVCYGMIGQRIDRISASIAKPTRVLPSIPSSSANIFILRFSQTAHNSHESTLVGWLIRDFSERLVV